MNARLIIRAFNRRGKSYSFGMALSEAEWAMVHCEVQTKLAMRLEMEERATDADRAWALAFSYWKAAAVLAEAERQVVAWSEEVTSISGRMLCTEDLWAAMDNGQTTVV